MEDLDTRVLRTALGWHDTGLPVVLVTVARTWGSSPRPPGSLMAINGRGETTGSVSGGCIEDDLIQRIRDGGVQAACASAAPTVLRYGISADQAHRFGLPCGGTVELVLERVEARSRLAPLLQACQQRHSTERVLDLRTGEVDLRPVPRGARGDGVPRLDDRTLSTYLGPQNRLILIGAGDLSRFMSQMALSLGFEVIVCDPRAEQRASWQLDGVTLSHEMPDDLILRLQPDARTAVVALTHDPKLDDLALIDALQSDAFYVGAIGSRRNSALRRARLHEHFDLSEATLDTLHGPAGLYIGSKTPAEIALSIMAEVVAVKNGVAALTPTPIAAGKQQLEHPSAGAAVRAGCGV
ncbi:xanthine dehydrogenase accessory factor [Sphaerotilus hippei]|uniref:Xanthine dehydrogenase accessory factor n=1 Tax=Sphaerotilus hippei TaxID=744406 RepID=A0A318H2N8_9BURK|nr:XdhC family protein [Sphaerotilus hippei]PXW97599.1 xanthine dehydrogenase accessory factor [Sphaerotilus hippei]